MHSLEILHLSVLSDAGGTRTSASVKENGPSRILEKSVGISTPPASKDMKHKVTSVAR